MIALGKETLDYHELSKEVDFPRLLNEFFGVTSIPCLINSPLREDKHPSFKIYSPDGTTLYFKDFSTGEHGGMIKLFSLLWGVTMPEAVDRLNKRIDSPVVKKDYRKVKISNTLESSKRLEVKVRKWKSCDKEYWESYGVTIEALINADVYPVSHRIIEREGKTVAIPMDKLAYAYVERKDKKVTIKLYQPLNNKGYKWLGTHRGDVVSLWNTLPEKGDICCLCSSVKDALCLTCNTGIPAIALQGEGYVMGNTAQRNLRSRFKRICVLYDNDDAGLEYARKTSESTGFENIVLPRFEGGKDLSDYYKTKGKEEFVSLMDKLFNKQTLQDGKKENL